MTRAAKAVTFVDQLAKEPLAEVLAVLADASEALNAGAIKQRLVGRGADKTAADRAWTKAQKRLRHHDGVEFAANTYRWRSTAPSTQDPALAEQIETLTSRCEELEGRLMAADTRSAELRQAQERQLKIDAIRALAELAMEVEELTATEAEPQVLVHRVRARVRREGLEPIDRAGEETIFDRTRHKPIVGGISDGVPVLVVRPGYTWKAPDGDVLIGKAVVEE